MSTEPEIQMHLEFFAHREVRGWAWKVGEATHSCEITIKDQDRVVATGVANMFRQDLAEAGIGEGHHAFNIDPRLSVFELDTKTIDVYVDGEKSASFELAPPAEPRSVLDEYSRAMEKRVDALLALHKERTMREIDSLLKRAKP